MTNPYGQDYQGGFMNPQGPYSQGQSGYPQGMPPAPHYGAPGYPQGIPPQQQRSNPLAVVSLILGIVGICCMFSSVGAVITGHVAKGQNKKDPSLTGNGLATTGLVLGWVFIGLQIAYLVFVVGLGMFQEINGFD